MISEKDEQNFSFPTTGHKLVYVKLHINQIHVRNPPKRNNGDAKNISAPHIPAVVSA